MTYTPQLTQEQLAEMIDREKLPAEQWVSIQGSPMQWFPLSFPASIAVKFSEIRPAPGALNEWGLPGNTPPHNPDNLPADKITESGKWRGIFPGENVPRDGVQYWSKSTGEWCDIWFGCRDYNESIIGRTSTLRVPVNTPFPKPPVKESLTPEPPAPVESETPRTDEPWRAELRERLERIHDGWGDHADTAREPMPRLEDVIAKSLRDNEGEFLTEDLHNFAYQLETELRAAQRKLDEAKDQAKELKDTRKQRDDWRHDAAVAQDYIRSLAMALGCEDGGTTPEAEIERLKSKLEEAHGLLERAKQCLVITIEELEDEHLYDSIHHATLTAINQHLAL